MINVQKAPFPWFGGKSKAADVVWNALGDVPHYVEPFAGSLAVLLNRPHEANRSYYSETVNDLDGLLCNAWRAIQLAPEETARHASWPVCETDLTARHYALVKWRDEEREAWLAASPDHYDAKMAGWWLWGISCWIGGGWCASDGPWWPDDDDRMRRHKRGAKRKPGVKRQLPHLGNNGQGVNHAGLREPGVSRQLPHLGNNGQGVNRPQLREPGVSRRRPHLTGDGRGVNHAGLREPGVKRKLPHIGDDGRGVNRPQLREPGTEFHDITMPELVRWFRWLSARLRHVRIINGDWRRVVTSGAAWTLPVRQGNGPCGVFLDPPYADTADRADGLYGKDSLTVAHDCREWALEAGTDPRWRIVFAGYSGEHGGAFEAAGWTAVDWFKAGFLTGGMGNTGRTTTHQQDRERLWLSPHCLGGSQSGQMGLFDD